MHVEVNYFKSSAQRTKYILKYIPGTNKTTLISICETRWVENYDALLGFIDIYCPVMYTLEELENTIIVTLRLNLHDYLMLILKANLLLA